MKQYIHEGKAEGWRREVEEAKKLSDHRAYWKTFGVTTVWSGGFQKEHIVGDR